MSNEELDNYEFKTLSDEEIKAQATLQTKGWKEQSNCIQAYIKGYKSRDKDFEALEALNERALHVIERMRTCSNCWHYHNDCYSGVVIRNPTEKDYKENLKNWGEQIPCKDKDQWVLGV